MINKYDLKIDEDLFNFINLEVIPDTNIKIDDFWKKFSNLINDLTPINENLLYKREGLQNKIDTWYKKKIGQDISINNNKNFLLDIGYIVKEGTDFKIDTKNVDPEIAKISGPQLVVPITNARYVLNAVNARWGSLYDALYGTDVLGDLPQTNNYDPLRGKKVISYAKNYLDKIYPLENSNWDQVIQIKLKNNKIIFFFFFFL